MAPTQPLLGRLGSWHTGLMRNVPALAFLVITLTFGCGDSDNPADTAGGGDGDATVSGGEGGTTDGGGGDGDSGTPGGGDDDGGTTTPSEPTTPGGYEPSTAEHCDGPCECSDGIDNDDDGVMDAQDPECQGPTDDDEGSFGTGISGDNRDLAWQDCFFDGDSGHGNDGCMRPTGCFTGEIAIEDPRCDVSDQCIEFCAAGTPNGCDCFGCCEVRVGDQVETVVVSDRCSSDDLDNTEACPRCTFAEECSNPCGRCELCPGKTFEDLPDDCFPSSPPPDGGMSEPPTPVCDNGETPCTGAEDCTSSERCEFGCCLPILI